MTKYKVGDRVRANPNDLYVKSLRVGGVVGTVVDIDLHDRVGLPYTVELPIDGNLTPLFFGDKHLLPFKGVKK